MTSNTPSVYHCSMPPDDDSKSGVEKRVHQRIDFFSKVKVVVPDEDTAVDVFAGNVSRGGMFLRSNRPLDRGKRVGLEFDIGEYPIKVEEGEVVWNKPFEPISIDGAPSGMGVQFRSMSDDARQRIESFIDDALEKNPAPESSEIPVSKPAPRDAPPSVKRLSSSPAPTAPEAETRVPASQPARMKLGIPASGEAGENPQADRQKQAQHPREPALPDSQAGGQMAQFSTPPPAKSRVLLFGGFVVLVAVAVFFTLLLVMPLDEAKNEKEKPAPAASDIKEQGSEKTGKSGGEKTEPEEGKQGDAVPAKQPKKDEVEKPAEDSAGAEEHTGPAADKVDEEANRQEKPAESTTIPTVGRPDFQQTPKGWKMVIESSKPLEVKHFTLKDPPRLALDLQDAEYTGDQRTLQAPAPFVARVRIGKQEGFIRFVLDFEGQKVPTHKVSPGDNKIVVLFKD